MPITIEQQIASVKREIAMRQAVYPKWVAAKKMLQHRADHEIEAMRAVLRTLETVLAPGVTVREPKQLGEGQSIETSEREARHG